MTNTHLAMPNERRIRELEGFIERVEERVAHLGTLPPDTLGKDRMLHAAINTLRKYKRTLRAVRTRRS